MEENGSKKSKVITRLFEHLREVDQRSEVLPIKNDTLREVCTQYSFKNQFDVTKFDTYESLPPCLRDAGFFIVHLGRGNHAFVKGEGYHYLEPVQETKDCRTGPTILDTLGLSEASAVSTLYNEKIVHDFLFGRTDIDLKVHTARRSNVTYRFQIGDNDLYADYLQLEIDGFFESDDTVAAVETKSGRPSNFEIRQLFTTMKYFEGFQKSRDIPSGYRIRYLFVSRLKKSKSDSIRIHEYEFRDSANPNSLSFVKAKQYNLISSAST